MLSLLVAIVELWQGLPLLSHLRCGQGPGIREGLLQTDHHNAACACAAKPVGDGLLWKSI